MEARIMDLELVLRTGAYLLSIYSLALGAFAIARFVLPSSARVGLQLLAVVAGQMVLCAVLVQALGLAGLLRAPLYFAASLAPGLLAVWLGRRSHPQRALLHLFERGFRVLVLAPGWGLGWLALSMLLFLAKTCFALPGNIDALTLHGPMVVEWVQSGSISLVSTWNYPQCWEYQFAANFLLLRCDLLAVVPGLLGAAALLLAVRELAAGFGLPGAAAWGIALLCGTLPVVWRETMKNDPIFALGLLLGLLAIGRAWRGLPGSFWLFQLGAFLVLGTKASGLFYVALLFALYLPLFLRRELRVSGRRPWRVAAGCLAWLLVVQVSAAAVQLRNYAATGNPVYPAKLKLGGYELFPGKVSLAGTSIFEQAQRTDTWKFLISGGNLAVGPEWPGLLLLLAAALCYFSFMVGMDLLERRRLLGREPPWRRLAPIAAGLSALLLFGLFFATPWSCNLSPGSCRYLATGASLRYAIAPICLAYLAAGALLWRLLPARRLSPLLAAAAPLWILFKWRDAALWPEDHSVPWKLLAAWATAAGLGRALSPLWRALRRRRALRWRLATAAAAGLALLAPLLLFARRNEALRDYGWMPAHRPLWTAVWNEIPPGSTIATNDGPLARYRYLLYGPRFANRVAVVPMAGPDFRGQVPPELVYLQFFAQGPGELQRATENLSREGWRVLARPSGAPVVLLAR